MSDVRLTATNPEDSSVVPVACNSKGELLLEEIPDQSFDGDLDGNLTVSGSASFADGSSVSGGTDIRVGNGSAAVVTNDGSGKATLAGSAFVLTNTSGVNTVFFNTLSGAADFQGDVIVGSRGKHWTLTEQSGLCHMVEVTRAATADLVEPDEPKYPKLRDVFHELDLIERALGEVMIQLRLDPPAGWPVWDGSDNLSGTD